MVYRPPLETTRFIFAAGLCAASGVALAAALPLPESIANPRYELVLIDAAGEAYVVDYGLTLDDCKARWRDFPGFALECNPDMGR